MPLGTRPLGQSFAREVVGVHLWEPQDDPTIHRLQGAVVIYLSLATIFAAIFGLIWELSPSAFVNLLTPVGGPEEVATMLYFSLTTLTTTGYGDIVAVDPFACSLANLESVVAQFFIVITVARLMTTEIADRRRRPRQ